VCPAGGFPCLRRPSVRLAWLPPAKRPRVVPGSATARQAAERRGVQPRSARAQLIAAPRPQLHISNSSPAFRLGAACLLPSLLLYVARSPTHPEIAVQNGSACLSHLSSRSGPPSSSQVSTPSPSPSFLRVDFVLSGSTFDAVITCIGDVLTCPIAPECRIRLGVHSF
jgi:hypothetical protein